VGVGVGRSGSGRKSGVGIPEAKRVWLPSGVNFKISPAGWSAVKRLPLLSKAKPRGAPRSVAKSLSSPLGVNFWILLGVGGVKSFDTKRFPNRSNAKSVQALTASVAVTKTLDVPSGVNFQTSEGSAA